MTVLKRPFPPDDVIFIDDIDMTAYFVLLRRRDQLYTVDAESMIVNIVDGSSEDDFDSDAIDRYDEIYAFRSVELEKYYSKLRELLAKRLTEQVSE